MNEMLKSDEVELVGHWRMVGDVMTQDAVCERIQWLTDSVLQELSVDGSNWSALYRDPSDNRLWELTYPQGQMHGGGPPKLHVVCDVEARQRYDY